MGSEGHQGSIKIPFFRLGKWRHPRYGVIEGTQEKLDAFQRNFRSNALGRPPYVRLGHMQEGAMTFGDAPAEAWVYDLVQEGPVLYALAHPTSDATLDAVKNKRFRFASAEYQDHYKSKDSGADVGPTLMAIGLTNEPFLTRLPELVALADGIHIDFEEVPNVVDETNLITKLSELVNRLIEGMKPGHTDGGLTEPDRQKLAEVDTLKAQLAQTQETLRLTESRITGSERAAWEATVECRLAELVGKGIPPVMCDQVKTILLASPDAATATVKLADDKTVSLADQMYAMLEALPEEHRVKLSQIGVQETKPLDSPEAIKQLADEDVRAMGGKITADGKYEL